jgi:hypothetical protein
MVQKLQNNTGNDMFDVAATIERALARAQLAAGGIVLIDGRICRDDETFKAWWKPESELTTATGEPIKASAKAIAAMTKASRSRH